MKKLSLSLFLILPFLPVFNFLKTEDINYAAYYSIIILFYILLSLILNKKKINFDKYFIYWGWFILITLFSWPLSFILKNYSFLTYPVTAISLYILLKYYCNNRDYLFFIKTIIITAVIQSIIGISQSFWGYPIFEKITPTIYESERNYLAYIIPSISALVRQGNGTYEHFNGLGAYLAIALPISYGYYKSVHSLKTIFIFVIISLGVITTFSRGALLGAFTGLFFIIVLSAKKKFNIFLLSGIIFIGLFFLWGVIVSYSQTTQNYSIRVYTWAVAFNTALENPFKLIYGYGPFYFREKLLGLYGTITNLHSGQLQILLELGIIGFLIFISLFRDAMKIASIYRKNIASVSITAGLLAFFVHQIFDNSYFGNTGILWFALLVIIFTIKNENIFQLKDNQK